MKKSLAMVLMFLPLGCVAQNAAEKDAARAACHRKGGETMLGTALYFIHDPNGYEYRHYIWCDGPHD